MPLDFGTKKVDVKSVAEGEVVKMTIVDVKDETFVNDAKEEIAYKVLVAVDTMKRDWEISLGRRQTPLVLTLKYFKPDKGDSVDMMCIGNDVRVFDGGESAVTPKWVVIGKS